MKKHLVIGALLGASVLSLAACSRDEVASVSLGVFTFKDIKLEALVDPQIPGVTCHVAYINSPLQLSDPANSSVACSQTGEITPEMIASIDKSKDGEVIFKKSQSVFFKSLKIRRIFDAKNQTLVYLSYSTKIANGSFKHSVASVPLWKTKAYRPEGYSASAQE